MKIAIQQVDDAGYSEFQEPDLNHPESAVWARMRGMLEEGLSKLGTV